MGASWCGWMTLDLCSGVFLSGVGATEGVLPLRTAAADAEGAAGCRDFIGGAIRREDFAGAVPDLPFEACLRVFADAIARTDRLRLGWLRTGLVREDAFVTGLREPVRDGALDLLRATCADFAEAREVRFGGLRRPAPRLLLDPLTTTSLGACTRHHHDSNAPILSRNSGLGDVPEHGNRNTL